MLILKPNKINCSDVWQHTFTDFGILTSQHIHINNIKGIGTVSGRLRFSAPHIRSVRMDDIIRQRHLRGGFLKVQGTSTFAIVNPDTSNTS